MAINYLQSFPMHKNKDIGIFSFLHAGDVWFSLDNTTYQNNSLVALEDIAKGIDSLLCMTNLTACCRQPDTDENLTVSGNWFFPNKTRVPSRNLSWDFYRARPENVLRLNRRRGGVEGIYWCAITVSMNVTQIIYIGVYNTSTGKV